MGYECLSQLPVCSFTYFHKDIKLPENCILKPEDTAMYLIKTYILLNFPELETYIVVILFPGRLLTWLSVIQGTAGSAPVG